MTGKHIQQKLLVVLIVVLTIFSCSKDSKINAESNTGFEKAFTKGPVSVEMTIDKTEIKTSEELKVLLSAKAKDSWTPSFPELSKNLDKFTVLKATDSDPKKNTDNSISISRTIILKPFLSGNYTIPALALDYTKGENKGTVLTDPVQIKVISLLPENKENLVIKDIKEPNTYNFRKLILYTLIAVILLLAGLVFFQLYKKRKAKQINTEITPFELAYSQLNALLEKNLPGSGEYKEFYFQLNQIVRIYIEKQFAIRAPEQTTEEFLKDLSVSTKISEKFKHMLKNFLVHSDLVKFASHTPEEDEINTSIEACKVFIKKTGEMINNNPAVEGEVL